MELFDVPPEGVVSRKMFMDRMVAVFVQRRSLQLTLGDYEVWNRFNLGSRWRSLVHQVITVLSQRDVVRRIARYDCPP